MLDRHRCINKDSARMPCSRAALVAIPLSVTLTSLAWPSSAFGRDLSTATGEAGVARPISESAPRFAGSLFAPAP